MSLGFDMDGGGGTLTTSVAAPTSIRMSTVCTLPGRDGDFGPLRAEAGQLGDDCVGAGGQRRRREACRRMPEVRWRSTPVARFRMVMVAPGTTASD